MRNFRRTAVLFVGDAVLTLYSTLMRKYLAFLFIVSIVLSSCAGSKPYYKTAEGKRKQKYYNDIQFGGRKARGY